MAMAHRGPDGTDIWHAGSIGIGIFCLPLNLLQEWQN